MNLRCKLVLAASVTASVMLTGCTVIKPITCAVVFPFQQLAKSADSKDPTQKHSEMPAAGVIAVAPVLIPLRYVYYVSYGTFAGLVSGFISDLNLITGHGSLKNGRRTLCKPMRTNAIK